MNAMRAKMMAEAARPIAITKPAYLKEAAGRVRRHNTSTERAQRAKALCAAGWKTAAVNSGWRVYINPETRKAYRLPEAWAIYSETTQWGPITPEDFLRNRGWGHADGGWRQRTNGMSPRRTLADAVRRECVEAVLTAAGWTKASWEITAEYWCWVHPLTGKRYDANKALALQTAMEAGK